MTNIDLLQERAINLKSKGLSTRKIAKEMGIGQTKAWKLTKYIYD